MRRLAEGNNVKQAGYQWTLGDKPPEIQQHSIAKHEILRAYLIAYIRTLISSPYQDQFRLTLVDGFAGGGIYRHATTGYEVPGSPFIMLEAVREAEFQVNQGRHKPVHLTLDYFFIETDLGAVQVLTHELKQRGYESQLEKTIFVRNVRFQETADEIIDFVLQKSQRAARALFLLDQYGYSDVPTALIKRIIHRLPGSEVILTFAVDSFLNFASDSTLTQGLLTKIGIPEVLRGRSIDDIKRSEKEWRLFIQSCLYKDLVDACGARFYTPFFIRSMQGHGDYWLIHLSQRPRARDVMTRIHWEKNNYFIHYGDTGLDMFHMLGYVPEHDSSYTGQQKFGFCFDESAKNASITRLTEQLPRLIYPDPDGMSFGELFASTCNNSPASADIYREALGQLLQLKEIEIISRDGKKRRSATQIHDNDQIIPPRQKSLSF